MKHIDEAQENIEFLKCSHDRLATHCNECFIPVMNAFIQHKLEGCHFINATLQETELEVWSVEFLRQT